MNTLITAKQLIKWVMEQYNGYEPLPQAIHILLNKHGLIKHNKYFKGKQVTLYSTPNAKRVIAQHFDELQYWDEQSYINLLKKENMNNNYKLKSIIKETIDKFINEQTLNNNLYDEWYQEEDYNGNIGEPGLIKSYDIGTYYTGQAEQDAQENGYDNMVDYLKFWFDEIKTECPWYWTKVNNNYKMQGNILFEENNVICIDFCDQILIYEDIDNSDFYNRLQSGQFYMK